MACAATLDSRVLASHASNTTRSGDWCMQEQAKQMDASALQQCDDERIATEIAAWVAQDAVWVDIPDAATKSKLAAGFGLGAAFASELRPAPAVNQPCVPQPWMGTYGEKLPVMPSQQLHEQCAPSY
jgi:hypothetical protein